MDAINDLRKKIDHIDDQIMNLLEERYILTTTIGVLKSKQNIAILNTNREHVIFDKTSNYSHFPQIKAVYKTIIEESKLLQRK